MVEEGDVAVQHGGAVGVHALEDLRLGVGDVGDRGEVADVRRLDVGDDGDVRAHQGGQLADLAGVVHADFEHAVDGVALHAREAQRHTPVIVEAAGAGGRSEEHTSELQSLMRISYAVFCLKKKKKQQK